MDAIPFILFILVWVLLYKYLVNKKQKGKILSHFLGLLAATIVMFISIIPLAPPVASIQSVQVEEVKNDIKKEDIQFKVLSVSDYSFTLKNKQAVSIVIGKNNTNYIDITIHRENIKKGFNLNTKEKTEDRKLISAMASWDKKQFFDNKNSFIVLDIVNLDYKNKIAILDIEVSLNEAKDNPTNLNIKLTANIEGELFDKLTDKTLIKKEVFKKIEKDLINKVNYKQNSPEYAFVNFMNFWNNKDFKQVANFTQRSWLHSEKNAEKTLSNLYGDYDFISAKILKIEKQTPTYYLITANIKYIRNYIPNKTIDVFIKASLIKEQNNWGVNPYSILSESKELN